MISMFTTPGFIEKDNKIEMTTPTFFRCSCGGITARLSSVLQFVNMSARSLNQAKPASHAIAKRWLEQEHLYEQIPVLKKHTYGVLIDNKLTDGKHRWVDVNAGAAIQVAQQFKEILNVPKLNK